MNAIITSQAVAIESKEGRAFLRKVARSRHEWRNEWRAHADHGTNWNVTFTRTINGGIGDPDHVVTVETDAHVHLYGKSGLLPEEGPARVRVPAADRLWLTGADARTAARLLLEGWRFTVVHSTGSPSSREHGLAFLYLSVERRGKSAADNWDSLVLGGQSVLVDGEFIVRGAVQ